MTTFSLNDEVLSETWLAHYCVPLRQGEEDAASPPDGVDGRASGSAWLKADLLDIVEYICPICRKSYYDWIWRAARHNNDGGKDAEGNLYIWHYMTTAYYRKESDLKTLLDKIMGRESTLTQWQTIGLHFLIGRRYWIIVRENWGVVIPPAAVGLLDDPPRQREYGYHVASVEMSEQACGVFDALYVEATAPPPIPDCGIMFLSDNDVSTDIGPVPVPTARRIKKPTDESL